MLTFFLFFSHVFFSKNQDNVEAVPSIFFTPSEVSQLLPGATTQQSTALPMITDAPSQKRIFLNLQALLYKNDKTWTFWLNNVLISSADNIKYLNQIVSGLHLVEVKHDGVKLSYQLGVNFPPVLIELKVGKGKFLPLKTPQNAG